MELEVLKCGRNIERLSLCASGPEDRVFLTRLWKALLLGDEIRIDMGGANALVYSSGASDVPMDELVWTKPEDLQS